ncbi:hypothetical protein ACEZCY_25930 [Streptacidiphilus sp. N1-12]|uniref:Uncharacterized protein n=2 Tax=Streptacidiphilus alkalitolerans TaxID=3342712 RepID=A0ABV6WKR6_9ACTN
MTTPTTAGLSPRTIIQLPITRRLAEQYLGNTVVPGTFEPSRLWGLCSRLVDVIDARSGAQARAYHGLADAESEFPVGDGLFVLRFQAHWPALFRASFGGQSTAGAARLGSTLVLPEPFLGTGYTKYAPVAVPEYWLELTEVPVGAELWHLSEDNAENSNEDGTDSWAVGLARYPGRYTGWQTFPAAEQLGLPSGPAAPAPAGSIARGPVATFQGAPYLADFGPNPGEATVYRIAEDGTTMSRPLEFSQVDALSYRRLLASWRGSRFELLANANGLASLALTSGNAEEAAQLGLPSAGRHAWRAQVPVDDLSELTEETRQITAPQPTP